MRKIDDYDAGSDELIEIIINNASSNAEKARASKELFERHNDRPDSSISDPYTNLFWSIMDKAGWKQSLDRFEGKVDIAHLTDT